MTAARNHFLAAAARRNQADSGFHQSDVALGRGLDPVTVERNLAAPAERQPGGRDNDRHVRIPQRLGALLKSADHHVDLVPVALERFEQDEHEVRAGREIRRVVSHDERREIR